MQKSRNSSFISVVFFVVSTIYTEVSIARDKIMRWVPAGASHIWRSNEKGWCNQGIHLQMNSYRKDFFTKNQKTDTSYNKDELLTKFKAIVNTDCPQANIARVSGFIDGRYVFEGCMSATENWMLREVFYSDDLGKVINPKYFDQKNKCNLPENTLLLGATYIVFTDQIARILSDDCDVFVQKKWKTSLKIASNTCKRWQSEFK